MAHIRLFLVGCGAHSFSVPYKTQNKTGPTKKIHIWICPFCPHLPMRDGPRPTYLTMGPTLVREKALCSILGAYNNSFWRKLKFFIIVLGINETRVLQRLQIIITSHMKFVFSLKKIKKNDIWSSYLMKKWVKVDQSYNRTCICIYINSI